jgi:hypothetical protein
VKKIDRALPALLVLLFAGRITQPIEASEAYAEGAFKSQSLAARSPIGTNLADVTFFSNNYPLIDAYKNSREWTAYQGSQSVDVDANGWVKSVKPGQGLFTQFFNATDGKYPKGNYILLYDGEGDLSPGDDAVAVGAPVKTGNTTRQIIRVTQTTYKGISLGLTYVNPSNYVRNIRVIMPGGGCSGNIAIYAVSPAGCSGAGSYVPFEQLYQTRTFHPLYLKTLRVYSTLRFMSYMRTNGSIQGNWNDRPKVTDASWGSDRGVPVEIMVALANTLNADPWFNMPHAANNTYVREFAKLVQAKLEPGRKVYIEYSNELWLDRRPQFDGPPNPVSSQFDYAANQGASLVTASECSQANAVASTKGTGCKILKQQRYQVKRSLEIFSLWQQNFGPITRVLSSTTLDTRISSLGNVNTNELLKYQDAYKKIDALAIAPYFGDFIYDANIRNEIKTRYATPRNFTGYFTRLNGELLQWMRNDLTEQKAIIDGYNAKLPVGGKKVALVAYEGGQILSIENDALFDPTVARFYKDLNRDPRMKQVYLNYLGLWRNVGGQLYNHFFNAGGWSEGQSYGALEFLSQPRSQAPKYDAIFTFIQQNPRWWSVK